jgi:S-adenosylmethionine decarboxylase
MRQGNEWIVDALGCSAQLLRDRQRLEDLCERIIADLGLSVVGTPLWHRFPPPGGITGMYLLHESHLTCHTFPECGGATFNLYCCWPRPAWRWEECLAGMLGAQEVYVRSVPRRVAVDLESVHCEAVGGTRS